MRRVREGALIAYLRYRHRCGDQQQPRMHQTVAYEPLVRRHRETALELLLERSERTVAYARQLFDRHVLEHMIVDNLLEVAAGDVDIAHQLALHAAVVVRHYQVDEFRHLDVFGCFVMLEYLLAQIAVGIAEETLGCIPCRHGDMIVETAPVARMAVGEVNSVRNVQMRQNMLEA